jgi:hypothetical protein
MRSPSFPKSTAFYLSDYRLIWQHRKRAKISPTTLLG